MKRLLGCLSLTAALLLALPMEALAADRLVPVGKVIGLQLKDGTVTVTAFDDALGMDARRAGLKIGDTVIAVEAKSVQGPEDIRRAVDAAGEMLNITVLRGGKKHTLKLPVKQTGEGKRLGIFLRQGIAGIGTVTWYDPESGAFGALGHGVSAGSGSLLQLTQGSAYRAEILSVRKGKSGKPGQLKGSADANAVCGSVLQNTPQGVFGKAESGWAGEAMPVAELEDVRVGAATIRSTVAAGEPRDYSVEILKIYPSERRSCRNFLLKVTDSRLLEITGGIVQGMSGSPIIQDGKLVGAVTHVLVNDPTRGYGIFIENMLDAAG